MSKTSIGSYFTNFKSLAKGGLGYLAYISIMPPSLSAFIHKKRGVKIDDYKSVYIAANVLIDTNFPEEITIGNDVYITRGAKIIAHTSYTPPVQRIVKREYTLGKVIIEDGAYIGVNAVVLPSVCIGKCVIIGAGAVVTKDVPAYAIAVGVPARIVGDVRELDIDAALTPERPADT
ncbi:acyltransferase [Kiloniella majae]|uniref:acyltransferase n=1 Tax=Kiloniella majae TaxID=1938558 RepID=UPI0013025133|nr:acyltransferase [Kiloniella majae]